jgi:hypothetical protein
VVYLALDVKPVDLAASDFRAHLFDDHGFTLWNPNWYGGHYTLTYSVLGPPLTALFGSVTVEIAATLASALLFAHVALRHFGPGAWLGVAWFGLAAATLVLHGQVTFALGTAIGLGAVAALQAGRPAVAAALALLTGLASPVAGLFLALAGTASALADRRRDALVTAAAAVAPVVLLAATFPEDGRQIYHASELFLLVGAAATVAAFAKGAIRTGALLYAALGIAAYAVHSPLGNNVLRLAALFGGPLLACVLTERRLPRVAIAAAALILAVFAFGQWRPAVNDVKKVANDPATEASYYAPLNAFLDRKPGSYRVEIPFTRAHWETAFVAPRVPLARGWERQTDRRYNAIFYTPGALTPRAYVAWLRDNAVRYVALADVPLDRSAIAEAALLRRHVPGLRPVWHDAHWQVWEVRRTKPMVSGAARMTALDPSSFTVRAGRRGVALVRLHYTPYWSLPRGAGCVSVARGGWTRLWLRGPGSVTVSARVSLAGFLGDHARCF